MAKTKLFRNLNQILKQAQFLEQHSIRDHLVDEMLQEIAFRRERRDFLKKSLLVAGAAATAPLFQACQTISQKDWLGVDAPVVIVGAGAAGLAAAYTLMKEKVPFVLYEAATRVGGRILTVPNFNASKQFIEAGAELVDSNHETLIRLAKELHVELEDYESFDRGVEAELFYVDGKVRTSREMLFAVRPLVKKTRTLSQTLFANDLEATYTSGGKSAAFVRFDQMSLREYLQRIEMEDWARKIVEVAYVGELGLDADKQSCISFLQMFDQDLKDGFSIFGESDEAKRVKGGSSQLTNALAKAVGEQNIRLGYRLAEIRQKDSGLRLSFKTEGGTKEIVSRKVILALPLTTLRNVEGVFDLPMSETKKNYVKEIGYGTNSKYMISFQSRFWRKTSKLAPASTGAVFADLASQSFWETSRLQKGEQGIITNFTGGSFGAKIAQSDREQILTDFSKIYGDARKQLSGESFLMNWSKVPLIQGSYACLMPGQYASFWGTGKEPELGGQLIFAGEHVSEDFQGFMNGGYESGVQAASHFVKTVQSVQTSRRFRYKTA